MSHRNLQLVVISFLGLISLTSGQSLERCVTPGGHPGLCISIKACQPLIELLTIDRNSRKEDFLRRSICGFQDLDPKVCCGNTGEIDMNEYLSIRNHSSTTPATQQSTAYWPIYAPSCGIQYDGSFYRVIDGPAELGGWPWLAALGYRPTSRSTSNNPRWLCGGTLVSSRHVITAAQCVNRDLYVVRLGDRDLNEDVQDGASPITVPIEQVHKHPRYSETHLTNDIAVLRLEWEVQFSDLIRPICLPLTDDIAKKDLSNAFPFLAGWGSLNTRTAITTDIQQIQVPVVPPEDCRKAFRSYNQTLIDNRVICAGYLRPDWGGCNGDSGNPLMLPRKGAFYIIGVASSHSRCGKRGFPGLYTRVLEFLDFIKSHLN